MRVVVDLIQGCVVGLDCRGTSVFSFFLESRPFPRLCVGGSPLVQVRDA
jgi:hypothetical protein